MFQWPIRVIRRTLGGSCFSKFKVFKALEPEFQLISRVDQ